MSISAPVKTDSNRDRLRRCKNDAMSVGGSNAAPVGVAAVMGVSAAAVKVGAAAVKVGAAAVKVGATVTAGTLLSGTAAAVGLVGAAVDVGAAAAGLVAAVDV